MKPIYALSIKQPWAWLICAGYKDVENRNWRTELRGRVYIHAGNNFDASGYNALVYYPEPLGFSRQCLIKVHSMGLLTFGAIIGEVDIVDCITDSASPWAEKGMNHYVLANPVLYDKPIPYKGRLGFFEPKLTEAAQ